jgi:hypothetical protein
MNSSGWLGVGASEWLAVGAIVVAALLILGVILWSNRDRHDPPVIEVSCGVSDSPRYEARIMGRIRAGYEGHPRDIILLTDRATERTYLVVTGCGVDEISRGDKQRTTFEE